MDRHGRRNDNQRMSQTLQATLNTLKLKHPEHGFVCSSPAGRWEDGSIVGNGTQGALIFGNPHQEEIVLSHEELFLPIYPKHDYIHLAPHLDQINELILDNRGHEAMRLTIDLAKQKGYLKRELTDPFIGGCALIIESQPSDCTEYARTTDFQTAESIVAWKDHGGLFHRRTFASRTRGLVATEISSPDGTHFDVSTKLARIERDLDLAFYDKAVADTAVTADGDFLSFRVKLNLMSPDQRLRGYCVVASVVAEGARKSVKENTLSIQDARSVLLLISIEPEFADSPVDPVALRKRLTGIAVDYDVIRAENASVHSSLFDRVSLAVCDRTEERVLTQDLQENSRVGQTSPALVQKAFDAGRYGTICSTGRFPPALQGIWTGTWRPRWSGDFTLNGNVQSAVAAALPGNYSECMRATLDYLSGMIDDFKTNARELFGFRGIYVPWRSSTHGQCHYAGMGRGDGTHAFPGMYWFAGTAWWAWFYYDYWLYTGDEEFFEKQLIPFFLESADFYEDYLCVEQDGKFVLVPSYSPENTPENGHCLQPNSTMTIACIRQFLRTLVALGDRLGTDQARVLTWSQMLEKMPGYRVDDNGAIAEWSWPGIANEENHRHASHLYPVYDEVAPEIAKDPALREACRTAIERRLEYRRKKDGAEMAFGLTQLGMSASYLRETELAYECVEWLTNSYWSPAMVSQHDPGDILNLDISGGLPAVVINMLLQSHPPKSSGESCQIIALPCLPQEWPDGSLKGARCRGGFEVSLTWNDGLLGSLELTSLRGQSCVVEYDGRTEELRLNQGESRILKYCHGQCAGLSFR